jgi:hypothetical protein
MTALETTEGCKPSSRHDSLLCDMELPGCA